MSLCVYVLFLKVYHKPEPNDFVSHGSACWIERSEKGRSVLRHLVEKVFLIICHFNTKWNESELALKLAFPNQRKHSS